MAASLSNNNDGTPVNKEAALSNTDLSIAVKTNVPPSRLEEGMEGMEGMDTYWILSQILAIRSRWMEEILHATTTNSLEEIDENRHR